MQDRLGARKNNALSLRVLKGNIVVSVVTGVINLSRGGVSLEVDGPIDLKKEYVLHFEEAGRSVSCSPVWMFEVGKREVDANMRLFRLGMRFADVHAP